MLKTGFHDNTREQHKLLALLMYSNIMKLRVKIARARVSRLHVAQKKTWKISQNRQITADKVWFRKSLARLASRKGHAREYYGRTSTCGLSRGRFCLGCSPTSRRSWMWVFFLILFDRLISSLLQSPSQKRNSSYENAVPKMFLKFKKSCWSSYMWFRRSFPAVFPAVAETLDPLHNREWGQFKMKKKDQ
jgi:GT2 family glycosyltransferase